MTMTDPIADMLTRIRNAIMVKAKEVSIPSSNLKVEIAKILKEEGYIHNFKVEDDNKQGILKLTLKYYKGKSVISGLERVSKPGRRVYCGADEVPRVMNGLGIAIISTSKGVLTDKKCRQLRVGGEVLCYIW
ncbi:30S ribosomal protein S8 [Candidatus Aminicenantes bacterium AC-708-M15]|nr:30S ribosomal protein S8 [SCandidatus Aminicenantes bacterium Aminicenantia_JdfR_composite]MCP2599121.1 30S ribosomal protein S8 [Candidatus Aminicenantes bacterium AC-335-B20]MCP2604074.1 30S ribosomal protein S8 [Candidatus Aminicenantes bacterium AC-708-M15]MCP2605363.1 30S ribosomal protein S8 [Candidatus Aminicenantes bacterium AC-335-O07]MCP2606026.1 30S ribosomal protein S8 [Candidatus Aminicenantes bacterium AC-708-I09]MCP2617870.1 30S ribosomal protein S8 [Candidatus Aminicenantes 